jgi:type I restriction enzyme S subunit
VPFEVPSGWVWTTLGSVCNFENGFTFSSDDYKKTGVPLIRISNISDNTIDLNGCVFIQKEIDDRFVVKKGDLLIALSGATTGKMGVYSTDKVAYLNQRVGNLRTIDTSVLCHEYRNIFMNSRTEAILKLAYGGAQPNISGSVICSFSFPLPPLAEQQRIASEVNHWFALIDQIDQGKSDLQTIIKQAKSKILNLAIHGKLVPQDPNDEPAIELLKRINPDFTPCDNGHYPIGWIKTILGELFSHNTGKALNSSNKEGMFKDYLTTSNVYWNKFDFTVIKQMPFKESELDKYTVTKGDLLVCEGGDIGRSAIWNYDYDICIQNHIHRLRPKIDLCVPFYYYTFAYLKENNLIGGKGIGLLGLSSNALHKIELPLPPLAEQQRIVQKIEELFSVLDNIQKALEV